jgi:hypothetical protein
MKGRARWKDDYTIEMNPAVPFQKTEGISNMVDETIDKPVLITRQADEASWVDYFKSLAEKLADSEELTRYAIAAIKDSVTGPGPDTPGESIAKVFEAHMRTRTELFKHMTHFISNINRE